MDKTIKELKSDPNIIAVYKFGSHGTKKETSLSDIDLCVFTKNKKLSNKEVLKIKSYGTDKLDISVFNRLPSYIKPNVFKGKPLFVKDKKEIAKISAISFRRYQDSKKYEERYWKRLKFNLINKKINR